MDYATLASAVSDSAALRRRRRLQPVGGPGDKIFPPTYPGEGRNAAPRHVFERRRINDSERWCVLIDSVQSQANRMEEALFAATREDGVAIPHVSVDFSDAGLDGITEITSLQAPHRVYDAILRDSLLDGLPFMKSEPGERLKKATMEDATALLELSPAALVFGAWHSTGEGGGLGAKFPRAITSEIIGIDVPIETYIVNERTGEIAPRTAGRRTGSRIDPLGVLRRVEVFEGEDGWDTEKAGAGKKAKKVRPSEINHGNIMPSVTELGVTCDHAEQTAVISFAGLRRLRFGDTGTAGAARDKAGRAYLAALGMLALAEMDARGYALRSRCDLTCDGKAPLELVQPDGETREIALDRDTARALYAEALEEARRAGFAIDAAPLTLRPQDKLVEIVRESQKHALEGEGGEADADE